MKKLLVLIISAILTIGLFISCGEKSKVIEGVETKFEDYSNDLISSYLDKDYKITADIYKNISTDTKIEYGNVNIEDNTATIEVKVTNKNFYRIIQRGGNIAINNVTHQTYDGLALLEETQWKVYNEEEPETRTATLELIKYKDKWYIENIEDFTYLFSGYY